MVTKFDKLKKHPRIVASVLIVTAVGALALSLSIGQQGLNPSYDGTYKDTVVVPDYQTILPVDKSIEQLGGWKRVGPPKGEAIFAFSDKVDNVRIDVTEQPLPESFKSGTASKVSDLALGYAANTKLTSDDTTIYVGTSIKGKQSVILTKYNLLILIKSQNRIDDDSWKDYIRKLNSINDSQVPKF